jgi:hypothetical protein
MKRFALVVGVVLFPLWIYLLYGASLWIMGYEVTSDPTVLAQKLLRENRPARDCLLLQSIDLGPRPTTQELKTSCVYKYAQLAKDPTACELLMPSEYGLACISNTVTDAYNNRPSMGFFEYRECERIPPEDERRDWCSYVLAHRSRSTLPCQQIKHAVVRQACILKFEAWEKYPALRVSSYFGRGSS